MTSDSSNPCILTTAFCFFLSALALRDQVSVLWFLEKTHPFVR